MGPGFCSGWYFVKSGHFRAQIYFCCWHELLSMVVFRLLSEFFFGETKYRYVLCGLSVFRPHSRLFSLWLDPRGILPLSHPSTNAAASGCCLIKMAGSCGRAAFALSKRTCFSGEPWLKPRTCLLLLSVLLSVWNRLYIQIIQLPCRFLRRHTNTLSAHKNGFFFSFLSFCFFFSWLLFPVRAPQVKAPLV